MIEIEKNRSEQEIESERYVMALLESHGMSSKKLGNLQHLFLLGMHNGLIMANNMRTGGVPHDSVVKDVRILSNYLNSRKRRVYSSIEKGTPDSLPEAPKQENV